MKPAMFYTMCLCALIFTGCEASSEPPATLCAGPGIAIVPTATRPVDPDLSLPPGPPPAGDDADYCPTPVPAATPATTVPTGFAATDVVNLSLDAPDQALAAVAAGDDMLAVAWLSPEGDIVVALSRGGDHFQTRRVDAGESVSLAFSKANRLHMVYARQGQIFYRAADQGAHPADVPAIPVHDPLYPITYAHNPRVVVDELNWAHVLYEQNGSLYKAKHLANDTWLTQFVAYGSDPAVLPFYNEKELTLYGIPTGTYWFGLLLAAPSENQVRLFRYLSWFNLWQPVAGFPLPPGETLLGPVGLDYRAVSPEEAWVVASWVTRQPAGSSPGPAYTQPLVGPANPLYPDRLANPHLIVEGLNALRLQADSGPYDVTLSQTFAVPAPGSEVIVFAQGLAPDGSVTLQLGLDPASGNDPGDPAVVWSALADPTAFTSFSISAPTAGTAATVFLRATYDGAAGSGLAAWDGVSVTNGSLSNGGFEGPFSSQSSLLVPDDWTVSYADSGNNPPASRDRDTLYAAWSADGGSTWSAPAVIAENRDGTGSLSGAFRPQVQPQISPATDPPSVTFFAIYESGDPPPGTSFLRFGRPVAIRCALGTSDCTDTPGTPLLPASVVRPSQHLLLAPDPFAPDRALMAWDALGSDYVSKDVYATTVTLR